VKLQFNTILMASAFALPPKIVERQWGPGERSKMYPSAKLDEKWSVEVLDSEPNLSALIHFNSSRDEVSWVSGDGSQVHTLHSRTRSRQAKAFTANNARALSPYQLKVGAKQEVRRGSWDLSKGILYFIPKPGDGNPLWNLPIADQLVDTDVDKDRSTWMGLSSYPNRMYHMFWIPGSRRGEALLEVLNWDDQSSSELINWASCGEGRSLLLENVKVKDEPRIRIHTMQANEKLRNLDWMGFAEAAGYWATRMVPRTCNEVYVATTTGTLRISR
jgi:hypothetical protein